MKSFSDELRARREAKNITLFEIAKKTRINIRYLEAIEQGTFDVLPYVRAFLKSYAEAIGLESDEILKKYTVVATGRNNSNAYQVIPEISDENISASVEKTEALLKQQIRTRQTIYIIIGIVFITLLSFFLLNYFNIVAQKETPTETTFSDVVKEQEKVYEIVPALDTADTVQQRLKEVVVLDSLRLSAIASDSVWISITLDSKPLRRGYVLAGSKRLWKAKDSIIISLSNAGNITFTLNGKEYGKLGKKGRRTFRYKFTVDTLKQYL
jgi:cytoskeletal protein RodZ